LFDLVDCVKSSTSSSAVENRIKTTNEVLNEEYVLKDMYKHDGTHLHPRYASLIEKALNLARQQQVVVDTRKKRE
jgi:hypothetical protein